MVCCSVFGVNIVNNQLTVKRVMRNTKIMPTISNVIKKNLANAAIDANKF